MSLCSFNIEDSKAGGDAEAPANPLTDELQDMGSRWLASVVPSGLFFTNDQGVYR